MYVYFTLENDIIKYKKRLSQSKVLIEYDIEFILLLLYY